MRNLALLIGVFLASASCLAAEERQPWIHAQSVLTAAMKDIDSSGGIRGIESDIPDLEKELANALPELSPIPVNADDAIILTDGIAQTLMIAAVAKDQKFKKVSAVPDPYPGIGLYLGSYYNEVGRPQDALRVLNAGIVVSDANGPGLGKHDPVLISEKGAAQEALRQFDDAIATYTAGVKLASNDDSDRARMFRGIGYSLTELGRLDDAERAYRKSLTCEPGNGHAENELKYIAQLRAGKPATSGALETVLPKPETQVPPGSCPKEW
jgi:tetratricopeptide (TPR) repeat protein